jgi:hypothetical protein
VHGLVVVTGGFAVLQEQGAHVGLGMVMSRTNCPWATASATARQSKTPEIDSQLIFNQIIVFHA